MTKTCAINLAPSVCTVCYAQLIELLHSASVSPDENLCTINFEPVISMFRSGMGPGRAFAHIVNTSSLSSSPRMPEESA